MVLAALARHPVWPALGPNMATPTRRILGYVVDEPARRPLGLGAGRGDVIVGLGIFGALLVIAAITTDVATAAGLLLVIVAAFAGLALTMSLVRRSLKRGLSDAARWTFGFVGRWFSF